MSGLHTKAPPRPAQSEEKALSDAQLCIRVMERLLDAVSDNPKTEAVYVDLVDLFMNVVQDELAPCAFELAYELFSEEEVVKTRRRERMASSDGPDNDA